MKMYFIDTLNNKAEVVDCDGKLQSLYNLICCEYIEIVERSINGVRCNIICDEEGKLRGVPKVSGVMMDGSDYFVGNLLICGLSNSKGDLTGLNVNDIKKIEYNILDLKCGLETRKVVAGIKY